MEIVVSKRFTVLQILLRGQLSQLIIHLSMPREHLSMQREHLSMPREHLSLMREYLTMLTGHLLMSLRRCLLLVMMRGVARST